MNAMLKKVTLFMAGLCVLLNWGCKSTEPTNAELDRQLSMKPAPVVIYKTKADYNRKVPVMLSDDRQQLISYPHPNDLRFSDGTFRYPLPLSSGYLLDRKGIGPKTVFLRMSYEEYFAQAPDPSTLLSLISDTDPIQEIWHCYLKINEKDITDSLNFIISNKLLSKRCRKIK